MFHDPIVDEVRRIREEYAARFNYDLDAICQDLKLRQARNGRKAVRLEPKRVQKPAKVKAE